MFRGPLFRWVLILTGGVVGFAVLVVGLSVHTAGMVPVLGFAVLWWASHEPSLDEELAALLSWESV